MYDSLCILDSYDLIVFNSGDDVPQTTETIDMILI